jgi:3-hydroxyacyl-CoA dehydrogenase
MGDLVTTTRDGDVGVLTLTNPPVNALSPAVIGDLRTTFESLAADPSVRAIVLTGAGKAFCGGADIKQFAALRSGGVAAANVFNPLLNALEESAKPVVAAINGTCLGGGLELAMACHYRLAAPTAQVGQPEVKLGLIPGAGGTQRLPRLVGVAKAAELCAAGNTVSAADAQKLGIVDRVVDGDLLADSIQFARGLTGPPRRTRDLPVTPFPVEPILAAVRQKAPHLLAPRKAAEAVAAAGRLPFAEGLKFEAKLFQECLQSDQSKALIHVFFSEREVGKVPGLPQPTLPIRRAAVAGAGTMGGGIATVYANAGIPVVVREVAQDSLDRGMQTIQKTLAASVLKGRITQAEADRRFGLIRPTLTFDDFGDADIIVEAVFEDLALKKKVFAELDKVARPDAILATNTSTLDLDAIAAATGRPQQVIGHHFFSPAPVMKLLEIVRGQHTNPTVIATSLALAKTLGKVGVLVGNGWGFVGNRLFFPYLREAQLLVEERASVDAVDASLTEFGMAMGPFAVDDLAGIDVGWRVRKEYPQLTPPGQRSPLVADKLYEMGRYGQKTGAGWYRYEGRKAVVDAEVTKLIEDMARGAGITRRSVPAAELVERPIYALINEGAKVLEEGVALRAADIDVIYVYGYGFPPHRGGPMWYADTVGLPTVLERVRQFEREHGAAWKPAGLLERLAADGKAFVDYDRNNSARA